MAAGMDFSKQYDVGQDDDLTVERKGVRELPAAGACLLRFVGYVEMGMHQPNNPTYKPGVETRLLFDVVSKKHMIDPGEGKAPYPHRMTVSMKKGMTGKSNYIKLFRAMNRAYNESYKHFVEMLGKGFLAEIFHTESGEGADKKKYANLHVDGNWSLKAPLMPSLDDEPVPIEVPEAHSPQQCLLWEPTVEQVSDELLMTMWESIFIDTPEDAEKSRNWMQETTRDAIDWDGSRLQGLTEEFLDLGDDAPPKTDEDVLGLDGNAGHGVDSSLLGI